jgi:hypothetical protein
VETKKNEREGVRKRKRRERREKPLLVLIHTLKQSD